MALTDTSALNKDRRAARGDVMQHRHFAVVASILRDYLALNDYMADDTKEDMVDHWADALERTNPRFNRARFVRAVTAP